jgi:hypothetical protein
LWRWYCIVWYVYKVNMRVCRELVGRSVGLKLIKYTLCTPKNAGKCLQKFRKLY